MIIKYKNEDMNNEVVEMSCDTTQFPAFTFCGTHAKPHGVQGSIKNYHHQLYPKMGHETRAVHLISY